MSAHDEAADVLDSAADVIERDGWIQGNLRTDRGVCLMGGLRFCGLIEENVAVGSSTLDAIRRVTSLVDPAFGSDIAEDLVAWNDAPERTEQEVLDALRLAAKQERIAADSEGVTA